MKRMISIILAVCLLAAVSPCLADEANEARTVIGADVTEEQRTEVYKTFGVEQGSVTEMSLTNEEEKSYLSGIVDSSVIGEKSISCVYLELLDKGEGLKVTTHNISWCSVAMYKSALATIGIDDAKLIVTSPVEGSSGTAALAGIYKAYEDMSGEKLSKTKELAGTLEISTTAALAEKIGNTKAVKIVTELKTMLPETKYMSDDELTAELQSIAEENDVTLTDEQTAELNSLCRTLEKLDPEELKAKAEALQKTLNGFAATMEKIGSFFASVGSFLKKAGSLLSGLFDQPVNNTYEKAPEIIIQETAEAQP